MSEPESLRARARTWVRGHPRLAFPLLYLGWAYLFWLPVLLSDASVWAFPNVLWFLLGGASPLLSGCLLAWLEGGKVALRSLIMRLWAWRGITFTLWGVILLFWLGFDLAMAGVARTLGITSTPIAPHWQLLSEPSALLFLLLLSFVFPAVEEIGLRGYYLETLQRHMQPLSAALLNGCVWAAWHAPFVAFPGYYANTTFHPSLSWWLPMIVAHTVLIAWVYQRSRGSLLAVLLFHGMMNFTGEWLRISPDMYPFMLWGTLVVAVMAGARLIRRVHCNNAEGDFPNVH